MPGIPKFARLRPRKRLQPEWIHDIPDLLEALKLSEIELYDRPAIEQLFRRGKTTAAKVLRRLGGTLSGNSLVITRELLIKRLRQAQRDPEIHWEMERRKSVALKIRALREGNVLVPAPPAVVRAELRVEGLPDTIEVSPGRLVIRCSDFSDLLQQLVLVARACTSDFDAVRDQVESRIEAPRVATANG